MKKHTGGCLCGKVRYSIVGDPAIVAVCHCTNCQKQSGAAFSVNLGIPEGNVALTGILSTFEDRGSSGGAVLRRFCPDCGSPVVSEVASFPGLSWIKAGTLDDHGWFKPSMELWCGSAQSWVPEFSGTQRFEANPPN
jgi:hypothetical protein